MSEVPSQNLLEALLNSWNRNNTIMLNLLHALPESSLGVRAMESSPTVAAAFTHIVYIRLVHVFEDAPNFPNLYPNTNGQTCGTKNAWRRCSVKVQGQYMTL